MAAYNSALSAFSLNAVVIPAVGSCSVSLPRPVVDVTPIGCWNTYFIEGVLSGTVALDVFYNKVDHNTLTTALLNVSGTTIPFVVIFDSNETTPGTPDDFISGNCIITSWDAVSTTADVVRGSFVLQIYGQVNVNGTLSTLGNGEVPEEE